MDRLWAEAHNFACGNLNRTATSSNKDMKSPYDMWHGEKPQAKPGFYLGPALNNPRDTHRILSQETGQMHITRDVTWRHVPTPAPLSAQQTLPAPVEGREDDEIAVEGREGTSIPG